MDWLLYEYRKRAVLPDKGGMPMTKNPSTAYGLRPFVCHADARDSGTFTSLQLQFNCKQKTSNSHRHSINDFNMADKAV